jgi:hypothetical protein
MANITGIVKSGNLVLTIPLLDKDKAHLSTTQKNLIRASSGGFQEIGDGLRANVTVISKP